DAESFLGPQPTVPTEEPEPIPFGYGSLEVGTAYNVRVTGQPFGKTYTPVSGATGTIQRGQGTNVVIECTTAANFNRYDLTVRIPAPPEVFSGLPGARVILTTGEQMYAKPATEAQVVGDHLEITFPAALYNASTTAAPFAWSVGASFTDPDGNEGRCQIANGAGTNPSNHVTTPIVGLSLTQLTSACQFKIAGSVAYSAPPGATPE